LIYNEILIIPKLVEGKRTGIFKMSCDFKGPEENPALAGLLAIMRHVSHLNCGGAFCYFSEAFFSDPRCALWMPSREFTERGYPADACGVPPGRDLSFRDLGKLS
jgi:hypothetical protein